MDREILEKMVLLQCRIEEKFSIIERELRKLTEARTCFERANASSMEAALNGIGPQWSRGEQETIQIEVMESVEPPEELPTPAQIEYLEGLRWPEIPKTKVEAMQILSELAKPHPSVSAIELPVSASQECLLRHFKFWEIPSPPKNYAEAYNRVSRLMSQKRPSDAQIIMARGLGHVDDIVNAAVAHDIIAYLKSNS